MNEDQSRQYRLQMLQREYDARAKEDTRRGSFDALAAAVSAPVFTSDNTTLIVDVSKWVPVADVAVLKAGGVRGIIARIGEGMNNEPDPTWAYYVQAAYDNDIPCMGYYVIHPELIDNAPGCVTEHLNRIKNFVQNKAITGIWIDAEITLDGRGLPIAPKWISDRTRSLIDETQRAFPNLVVGLYTGGWYIDGFSPEMKNWVHKYPLWWAYYTQPIGNRIAISWEQLKNYYPVKLPVNLPPDATGKGTAKLNLWQWSGDHFQLPGMWARADKSLLAAADVNFFMGSEEAWYDFAGYFPRTTPDPTDPTKPDPQYPPPATGDMATVLAKLDALQADVTKIKSHFRD